MKPSRSPKRRYRTSCVRLFGALLLLPLLYGAARADTGTPATPLLVGADISWVPQQEQEGRRFSDQGKQKDILAILAAHGFNAVRLRVFCDPRAAGGYSPEGYCDLDQTLQMAKRIQAAHLRFLLDIHYSDTWADPAHQTKPSAWAALPLADLKARVHDYTRQVLTALKAQKTPPEMVQIGNEIDGGFLWPDGKVWEAGREDAFCDLLKAGIAGAKETLPSVRIVLHISSGGNNEHTRAFFDLVTRHGVPFDVIGLSYYPEWQGPTENLRQNLLDIAGRYPQPILVAEYTAPDGPAVYEIVRSLPNGKGLGAFIWEPTRWPRSNPALFDAEGAAKSAISVYGSLSRNIPMNAGK